MKTTLNALLKAKQNMIEEFDRLIEAENQAIYDRTCNSLDTKSDTKSDKAIRYFNDDETESDNDKVIGHFKDID